MALNQEEKKILQDMSNSQYGIILRKYLDGEMESIRDVTSAKSWDEAQANQKVVGIVEKLFGFMRNEQVKEKNKNQYT